VAIIVRLALTLLSERVRDRIGDRVSVPAGRAE
jgi:hypothetical protein